jgi:hypothetical protein
VDEPDGDISRKLIINALGYRNWENKLCCAPQLSTPQPTPKPAPPDLANARLRSVVVPLAHRQAQREPDLPAQREKLGNKCDYEDTAAHGLTVLRLGEGNLHAMPVLGKISTPGPPQPRCRA